MKMKMKLDGKLNVCGKHKLGHKIGHKHVTKASTPDHIPKPAGLFKLKGNRF